MDKGTSDKGIRISFAQEEREDKTLTRITCGITGRSFMRCLTNSSVFTTEITETRESDTRMPGSKIIGSVSHI